MFVTKIDTLFRSILVLLKSGILYYFVWFAKISLVVDSPMSGSMSAKKSLFPEFSFPSQ